MISHLELGSSNGIDDQQISTEERKELKGLRSKQEILKDKLESKQLRKKYKGLEQLKNQE